MNGNKMLVPLFSFLAIMLVGCKWGHTQQNENSENQPQVKIDVNKETDENGNIIRYDSTYSFSWSSSGDLNVDSVLKQFGFSTRSWVHEDNEDPFGSSFFDHSDFGFDFSTHFKEMEEFQQRMMQRHEEMLKGFYQDQILIPAPEDSVTRPKPKPTQTGRTYKI
jgi:hypothetical protein